MPTDSSETGAPRSLPEEVRDTELPNVNTVNYMDTREQILVAARDLVVCEGLIGFSMRKVAKACGLSATAIYRHFEDKDALLTRAVQEGFRIFGAYLMDALQESSPLDRLRCSGKRYFDFSEDHARYYALIFMTDCKALGLQQLDQQADGEARGTFQFLVDRIVECQRAKVVRTGDSEAIAVWVWSSLHGLASLRLSGNLDVEADVYASLRHSQLEAVFCGLTQSDSLYGASSSR